MSVSLLREKWYCRIFPCTCVIIVAYARRALDIRSIQDIMDSVTQMLHYRRLGAIGPHRIEFVHLLDLLRS